MHRRNLGGARLEASERVLLRARHSGDKPSSEQIAWTLNVSRGGLRLVVEEPLEVGAELQVTIGDEAPRLARVVWLREEADGQIAGMEFIDVEGAKVPDSLPPPPLSKD